MIERPSAIGTLRHAPFFEALGGLSESDAEWPATSAGLMVLRLVDAWFSEGSEAPQVSVWGFQGVRTAIDAIPQDLAVHAILTHIVDSIESAAVPDIEQLAPWLMRYGRCLDYDARWEQAIDVYQTILGYAPHVLDPRLSIDARMRLGSCFRVIGRFDDALSAYSEAKRVAEVADDRMKVVHAEVGEGMVAAARGNLPKAESILDRAIAAAADGQFDEVRAIALHGRAFVANARGQHEASARFAYEALAHTYNLSSRDRLLLDLAASLTQLGSLDAARDALLVVAATGQAQFVRWMAMVNLMEVGALQRNEPLVDQFRRQLMDAPLPTQARANYLYYSAFGYAAFGKFAAAEAALTQASELAEQHGINQLAFQIEELLRSVRQGIATERRATRDVVGIRDIVEGVAEMREHANV